MYKVNENLKNNILSRIPEDYSNLEKALFIYKELCKTLEYSVEYFFDEDNVKDEFLDIRNLEKVDGETNKEVVCFTFNAIYIALLMEADVCDKDTISHKDVLGKEDPTRFLSDHQSLTLTIDSQQYSVDSTYGVLDDNDLVDSKFGVPSFDGWSLSEESQSEDFEKFDKAIEKVTEEEREVTNLGLKYVTGKGKDLLDLPVTERRDLFFRLLQHAPKSSIHGLNYLLRLKNSLFRRKEIDGLTRYMHLLFAKEAETNQPKVLFFFNPEGYTEDKGFENFDKLEVYEIDLDSRKIIPQETETVKEDFNQGKYVLRGGQKTTPKMFEEGKIRIKPVFKDNKPQYDRSQHPINIEYWVREYLLTGKQVRWNKEKNCEE